MINKNIQLSQTFLVNSAYTPNRISAYIKLAKNSDINKPINISSNSSIDACNFSKIKKLTKNKSTFILLDTQSGFSGAGYMRYKYFTLECDTVQYPITGAQSGTVYVWARVIKFDADIKLKFTFQDSTVVLISDSLTPISTWFWVSALFQSVLLLDFSCGISGALYGLFGIDKIIFTYDSIIDPSVSDIDYTLPSYITIHARVFETDGVLPTSSLLIYDYKSTILNMTLDGWCHFNVNPIHLSININFTDLYYSFVLCSSGNSSRKYVIWLVSDDKAPDGTSSSIKH